MSLKWAILTLYFITSAAQAGGYSKLKRRYFFGKQIDKESFEKVVRGIIWNCESHFKEGKREARENFRFLKDHQGIFDRVTNFRFELDEGLVGHFPSGNETLRVDVKRTKKGSLIMRRGEGKLKSYIFCDVKNSRKGNQERLVQSFDHEVLAISAKMDGKIFVILEPSTGIPVLEVYDQDWKFINSINAVDFHKEIGSSEFNSFSRQPQLVNHGGKLFLYGSFMNKDLNFEQMLIEVNEEFPSSKIIKRGIIKGDLSFSVDGNIHVFGFNSRDSNSSLYTELNSTGEVVRNLDLKQMRVPTSLIGSVLNDGHLSVASRCDENFRSLYDCPKKTENYDGISITNNQGEFLKFISEYDYYFSKLGINPIVVDIKYKEDGSFFVAYKRGQNSLETTLFRYDSEGNYLESWGIDAREKNGYYLATKDSSEDIQIIGDTVYTFQFNRVFTIELNK